ncbi:MAG: hypothetical protein V3U17_00420 [Thermoplasmata archaeon]
MDIEIVPFDPQTATKEEWARYHVFRRLRHQETEPEDPMYRDRTFETFLKHRDPHWKHTRFVVLRKGGPNAQIGAFDYNITPEDSPDYTENGHLAYVSLEVLGPDRRQGVGHQLLAHAVELAKADHRTLLIGGSDEEDGFAFMKAIGAEMASKGQESRLRLKEIDWDMVRTWADEGPERSPESTLRFYENYVPDELLEDFSEAFTEMINQQPRDDLAIGDEILTPERIRTWEELLVAAGGTGLGAVTLEADGRVSGFTGVGYFPEKATMLHQYLTGVRLVYRGRGLGKWLKGAMLLRVQERFPKVEVIVTGNATSNRAMLSINERLGFKFHKEGIDAQISVEASEAWLDRHPAGDS